MFCARRVPLIRASELKGLEKHPRHMLDVARFEEELRNNVEITRKLNIISEKEKRNKHAIIECQRAVEVAEWYLSLVHEREAQINNSNAKVEDLNYKSQLELFKIGHSKQLEQQKKNLKLEKEGPPKFRAGKTALLDMREKYLGQIVSRICGRISQPQAHNTPKATSSRIDISDLVDWGVPGLSDPAFEVDFVALDFAIQRTTPEPSTKAGGKLVMKKIRKDDETSL
jgi:hypothetical protein